MNKVLTLIFCALLIGCEAAHSKNKKQKYRVDKNLIVNVTGRGDVLSPDQCSPTIGAGGNYVEDSTSLSGKCERGGISPVIAKEGKNKYLEFKTNGVAIPGNDRTELARTSYFNFGRTTYISYKVRIPSTSPVHPRGKMYYALQLWQCSPLSPIAGMRISEGTSHDVNFVVRHNNSVTPVTHRYSLKPDTWHQFLIVTNPNSTGEGSFQVIADGNDLGTWKGSYGSETAKCSGNVNTPPQMYRVKWGIYKSNDPGKVFTLHYDDFKIGTTLESVQ
jgi:hypothetical protein